MAKVKITGHASGTGILTVTAPDTDENRTITLPDETATLSTFDPDGAVVINDTGADVDFRVEGDTDANALFVQGSDSKVGIGTGNPDANLHIKSSATNLPVLKLENTYESGGGTATVTGNAPIIELYANDSGTAQPDSQELGIIEFRGENKDTSAEELYVRIVGTNGDANTTGELKFETQQSNTMTTALTIRGDRGLSQFTAKAWCSFNGTGTVAIIDSHYISSITDLGTGDYTVTFTSSMSDADYSVVGSVIGSDNRCFACGPLRGTASHSARVIHHTGDITDAKVNTIVFGD